MDVLRDYPKATSFCPPVTDFIAGELTGRAIWHTIRPQGTEDWLIIMTTGDRGLYRSKERKELRAEVGDVTLYRPGAFQDYQFDPESAGWDLLYSHFLPRPAWLPWMGWPEFAEGFLTLRVSDASLWRQITNRMRDAVRISRDAGERWIDFGQNALEEVLLWCDLTNPRRGTLPDPRVRKAVDFLNANYRKPYDEARLAEVAGLSASRLRHLFRAQIGDSPRHYVEEHRMRRARDLLVTSRLNIGEIAQELGFENPFYFTLRFRKHTGESPSGYRQRMTQSSGVKKLKIAKR